MSRPRSQRSMGRTRDGDRREERGPDDERHHQAVRADPTCPGSTACSRRRRAATATRRLERAQAERDGEGFGLARCCGAFRCTTGGYRPIGRFCSDAVRAERVGSSGSGRAPPAPAGLRPVEQVVGVAERVGDPVLAAVADEQDVGVLQRAVQCAQRPRPCPLSGSTPGSFPGSQCAPWMTHGTMCSRRQNVATRSPAGLAARKPSSRSTATPHQLQDSLTAGKVPLKQDGVASIPMPERPTDASPSSRATRPGRSCSTRRCACSTPRSSGCRWTSSASTSRWRTAARRATASSTRPRRRCAGSGLGIKAATVTPEGKDDVGSPNRLMREGIDGKVIIRTGRRIPGVTPPLGGVATHLRRPHGRRGRVRCRGVARDDERADENAFRPRISRSTCRRDLRVGFRIAAAMGAKVYGGPKWTVAPVYEGSQGGDRRGRRALSRRHYQPLLIYATYAGLIIGARTRRW